MVSPGHETNASSAAARIPSARRGVLLDRSPRAAVRSHKMVPTKHEIVRSIYGVAFEERASFKDTYGGEAGHVFLECVPIRPRDRRIEDRRSSSAIRSAAARSCRS